jgi:ATP-dependent Lon protease
VFKESLKIAQTYARSLLRTLDPTNTVLEHGTVHLHVPQGAVPKDGPSAGCTTVSALLSLAFDTPVIQDVAMTGAPACAAARSAGCIPVLCWVVHCTCLPAFCHAHAHLTIGWWCARSALSRVHAAAHAEGCYAGEISLSGRVLPIGGVKEKTLAAKRSQVKTVIFPAANRRDWEELDSELRAGLEPVFAEHYVDLIELLFPSIAEKHSAALAAVKELSQGLR